MFYVYALYSLRTQFVYVGMTSDLQRRLAEHMNGQVRSTKGFLPLVHFSTEEFPTRAAARIREKQLKSGSGKEGLLAKLKIHLNSN